MNSRPETPPAREISRISPYLRGQLFLFDRPMLPGYSSSQGYKLLAVFLVLEAIVRPLLKYGARAMGITHRDWWSLLQLSFLLVLACWLVTRLAGVRLSELGLYPWRRWALTEKLYFPQILGITVAVFTVTQWDELKALRTRSDLGRIGLFVFVPQMIWGLYQEFVYRGILQTELVRRCGARLGILLSNLIFTFGPLHYYHFAAARDHAGHLWIFAAIFAIGLYFAMLFHRSGNMWIVGTLHGLGDSFIDGLGQVSRMVS